MIERALEKNKRACFCAGYRPPIGKYCESVAKHRVKSQFPECLFTKEGEKLHDRSLAALEDNHI